MTASWFLHAINPWFWLFSSLSVSLLQLRCAQQGRYRTAVIAAWAVTLVVGCALVSAAGLGLLLGQPARDAGALGLSGGIIGSVCIIGFRELRNLYTQAELRKTIADDL